MLGTGSGCGVPEAERIFAMPWRILQQRRCVEAYCTPAELRTFLLDELFNARRHRLCIRRMTTSDSVLRVNVEYQVPVNFYLFQRAFKFSAVGSGLLMRTSSN